MQLHSTLDNNCKMSGPRLNLLGIEKIIMQISGSIPLLFTKGDKAEIVCTKIT